MRQFESFRYAQSIYHISWVIACVHVTDIIVIKRTIIIILSPSQLTTQIADQGKMFIKCCDFEASRRSVIVLVNCRMVTVAKCLINKFVRRMLQHSETFVLIYLRLTVPSSSP